MKASARASDYSVRFYLLRDGHGYVTDAVTFTAAEYQKLEKDYLSFLTTGAPRGAAYQVLRGSPPKIESTVVLDFASVSAFGGV